jgi:hypothetical protein
MHHTEWMLSNDGLGSHEWFTLSKIIYSRNSEFIFLAFFQVSDLALGGAAEFADGLPFARLVFLFHYVMTDWRSAIILEKKPNVGNKQHNSKGVPTNGGSQASLHPSGVISDTTRGPSGEAGLSLTTTLMLAESVPLGLRKVTL